ncbi:type III-B CRISPR module RAMP protein Cmr1 [Methylacidimicrobium sp. B4]|uniref:type III-B CRISPR module RAMP protein Cmr1 n=1 Tax=Methylacidimicrobium sp. B4 TaxID=2796139 RepID=UPI001A907855|nr:type III-B CRISPR module RAMP protein Cmr1 [Methylacidimicrobium sp. B4]QSR84641.1 type III-B CRISPR module RAMP protein Cmr1 [Methylacidimicrobium sp. B4]
MNPAPYDFEFLTPCFCGGADPTKAELRAPSIRGALRWWFRALGGTQEQEEQIFGTVRDKAKASSLVIRVERKPCGGEADWAQKPLKQDNGGYIWYFLEKGNRWRKEAALYPGSKATVDVLFRHPLAPVDEEKLKKAWEAFCRFGSIGYRATRAAGAFRVERFDGSLEEYERAAETILKPAGFVVLFFPDKRKNWRSIARFAEEKLKDPLRTNFPGSCPSPLGSADPRQTSAVYLRPLKVGAEDYYLMAFEAPHDRVVGEKSRLNKNGENEENKSVLNLVFHDPAPYGGGRGTIRP